MIKKDFLPHLLLAIGMSCKAQFINKGDLSLYNEKIIIIDDFFNDKNATVINDGSFYFNNDFVNKNNFSYIKGGNTYFIGNNEVLISNFSTDYFNVIFDNKSFKDIAVIEDFIINNEAHFYNGILNNEKPIIFSKTSKALNQTDLSYIKNYVTKLGDNNFDCPVGDLDTNYSNTLNLKFASPDALADFKYNLKSTLIYPHNQKSNEVKQINELEYFEVQNSNQKKADLSFKINSKNVSKNVLNDLYGTDLGIVFYSFEKKIWLPLGGEISSGTISINDIILKDGIYTLGRVFNEEKALKDLLVYNAVSKSRNEKNDKLFIRGIDLFPNNNITIYNRYGNEIYYKEHYINENGWDGNNSESGTYFYILSFRTQNGETQTRKGFIQLN
ncbi:gliding motility-associated C-terminal domain-containing protein [Flavobacterium oreochromis]|uniref:gliding motility-associated C-terminal domain-containing protein n=1 Tax=Flavobacterium oreochromis TaxID=2906078 RepID=UPI00385D3572